MPQPENDWLSGALQGDEEKLAALYDAYSPALFRYAYRLLGNEQAAEDIVAEAFYRFLRLLKAGGGPKDHLKAYLYRVAHNLIMDRFRRQPPVELNLELGSEDLSDESEGPDQQTERAHAQASVRQSLWKLTPDQRQVVVLKFFEQLSNEEVSQVLHKPVGAVKSLQHRALEALRRMLAGEAV